MTSLPSTIPITLLSDSPPPIDFNEQDDDNDSGLSPTLTLGDDDFGDYGSPAVMNTNLRDFSNADALSLPRTPLQQEHSSSTTSGFTDFPPNIDDSGGFFNINNNMPPSLEHKSSTPPPTNDERKNKNLVEAFNYEISSSSPLKEKFDTIVQHDENALYDDFDAFQNFNETNYNDSVEVSRDLNSINEIPSSPTPLNIYQNEEISSTSSPVTSLSLPSLENSPHKYSKDDSEFCCELQTDKKANTNENETKESVEINEQSTKNFNVDNDCSLMVVLEDILDDSSDDDERYSPKKVKNFTIVDENSEEFFAIHIIEEKEAEHGKPASNDVVDPTIESVTENEAADDDDDAEFDDFARFETAKPTTTTSNVIATDAKEENVVVPQIVENFTFDADFSNLTNNNNNNEKINDEAPQSSPTVENSLNEKSDCDSHQETSNESFDDFDDFQDFQATEPSIEIEANEIEKSETAKINLNKISIASSANENLKENFEQLEQSTEDENNDNGDDDDFGDFSCTTFDSNVTIPPKKEIITVETLNNIIPTATNNINNRLKPILEMMFPSSSTTTTTTTSEANENDITVQPVTENTSRVKLEAIDTAKALNYQWQNSEMRHSLIKSLGIDSRNILYGDNWNSSMPRFAANLSFNPLKPMKPQPVANNASIAASTSTSATMTSTMADSDVSTTFGTPSTSMQKTIDGAGTVANNGKYVFNTKSDIPAVEFDWNTSGLVNPLDGPKEITNSREIETVHTTQSGEFDTSDDQWQQHKQQQHQQQEESESKQHESTINKQDSSDIDTTTTASAISDTTTAAAISSNVPSDSIGNNINKNGNNFDLEQKIPACQIIPNYSSMPIIVNYNDKLNLHKNDNIEIPATATAIGPMHMRTLAPLSRTFSNNNHNNNNNGDDDSEDEVIVTSTYAGPLKETHIYTPPKGERVKSVNHSSSTSTAATATSSKVSPIDFDYEKAAAGIIIDETVVKKEYRDVVYDPGFSLDSNRTLRTELKDELMTPVMMQKTEINVDIPVTKCDPLPSEEQQKQQQQESETDFDDEFTDFQSVAPSATVIVANDSNSLKHVGVVSIANNNRTPASPKMLTKAKDASLNSRTATPTISDEMILSPAILLPQTIALDSNKPKIEWGETATQINPEELARIEELFPQPKTVKPKESTSLNSSQKSTPTHIKNTSSTLSISASIAHKEQTAGNDDDDWSDFVSVPVPMTAAQKMTAVSNNIAALNGPTLNVNNNRNMLSTASPIISPHRQNRPLPAGGSPQFQRILPQSSTSTKMTNIATANHNSNDDEWSDFVSSTPTPIVNNVVAPQLQNTTTQFNSAAWQNANLYNNPLSLYHHNPTNVTSKSQQRPTTSQQQQQQQQKYRSNMSNNNHNNNNNNIYNNNNINMYLSNHQQHQQQHQHHQYLQQQQQQQQQQYFPPPQQIHIMQDFSTAPPAAYQQRTTSASIPQINATVNNQFQVGSAKIAPSISLIPDLGFVAPAVPTHTAFINSLPKPSFSMKK